MWLLADAVAQPAVAGSSTGVLSSAVEDGAWVGRPDRRVGLGLPVGDRRPRRVLEVWEGLMVGVSRQPLVDESLHHAAPAQGAPDERAAALRLEVLLEARVASVALPSLGHLGLDVGVGHREVLGIGDLREDEQGLGPPLGIRPELGVEVVGGLVDRLEIGLLADALARERALELVVHDLDLLVDQHFGQLDGRVGDCVFDDPVGELVAGAVDGIALEPCLDVGLERVDRLEAPEAGQEVLVEVRQDLLAELLELDAEVGRLAGHLRLRVIVRERDIEFGRVTDLEPDQVGLEARDEALLPEDERHPLGRPAIEGLAVAGADERDDRVVAVLRATVLDSCQRRVLVAQLLDDLVDPGVVDRLDLGLEVEGPVVAELHFRPNRNGRLEDERLALLGLDDFDVGVRQREDVLLDERLAIGVLHQVIDGLVHDDAGTEVPLQDGARRLARAEAGDPGPAREGADGRVERAVESIRGSSIWSWTVDLGAGVRVICIDGEYRAGPREGLATVVAGSRHPTRRTVADSRRSRGRARPRRVPVLDSRVDAPSGLRRTPSLAKTRLMVAFIP